MTSEVQGPEIQAASKKLLEGSNPLDDDKLHEECGVFGVFGTPDASALTALGKSVV